MNLLVPHCFLSEMAFPCSLGFFYFRGSFLGQSIVLHLHLFSALHNWILVVGILHLDVDMGSSAWVWVQSTDKS